eukprot:8838696-Pyramimonas_sp.AAC.1
MCGSRAIAAVCATMPTGSRATIRWQRTAEAASGRREAAGGRRPRRERGQAGRTSAAGAPERTP